MNLPPLFPPINFDCKGAGGGDQSFGSHCSKDCFDPGQDVAFSVPVMFGPDENLEQNSVITET